MIRHIPCPTGNGYFKIQDFMKLGFGLDRREMTSSGDDQPGRSIFHFTSFSALRLAGSHSLPAKMIPPPHDNIIFPLAKILFPPAKMILSHAKSISLPAKMIFPSAKIGFPFAK